MVCWLLDQLDIGGGNVDPGDMEQISREYDYSLV